MVANRALMSSIRPTDEICAARALDPTKTNRVGFYSTDYPSHEMVVGRFVFDVCFQLVYSLSGYPMVLFRRVWFWSVLFNYLCY